MITYIIKSSISLIILFGLYWFLLRKEKLFVFNRYFLIFSIVFSLTVPFISIPVNFRTIPGLGTLDPSYDYISPEISITDNYVTESPAGNVENSVIKAPLINPRVILITLYLFAVAFFLFRFLRNIFIIARRTKTSEKIDFNRYRIILTDEKTDPCCFFSNIYLNRDDYLKGRIERELLEHELEHIRQSHTIDIILIELLKIFYWFNPIHVLYDRAIRINHEYLADNEVIRDMPDIVCYSDKLLGFISRRISLSLTSGSKNSYTRLRLAMMLKSGSGRLINGTRIALTLCLGSAVFMLLSFKEIEKHSIIINNSVAETEVTQNVVRGVVMTEEGVLLSFAGVKTTNKNGAPFETLTDMDGRFTINDIRPGDTLIIDFSGFKEKAVRADFSEYMVVKLERIPDFKGIRNVLRIQEVNFRNSDFSPANAFMVINGLIEDNKEVLHIKPEEVRTIKAVKGKEALSKYGERGKDGVVEITLFGNTDISKKEKESGGIVADSVKYKTLFSIDHVTIKGETMDIPISALQSVNIWTYHFLDSTNKNKKELRNISIMTRDYYRVKGTVTNELGKPLPGVKINAAGNPRTEISDKNGHFELRDVREGVLLELSLSGYKPYYLATGSVAFTTDLSIPLQRENSPDNDIYETAETMPQYPGGEIELLKFLAENTKYPEAAKTKKVQGKVIVRFVVNKDGNVERVSVLEGVNPDLDNEAMRVIGKLSGFTPGIVRGKPVSVYYMIPINFALPRTVTNN